MTSHQPIYESPRLYDLAFSYRNFAQEAEFLRRVCTRRVGEAPATFLELAAGPARHAMEMARTGVEASALDLSEAMAAYAPGIAQSRGLKLPYIVADMTRFELPTRFDCIACMLCSLTYLLTDGELLAHLKCVAAALSDRGLYVVELPHPSEPTDAKTSQKWTMPDEGGELLVEWRGMGRVADISTTAVRLEYQPKNGGPPWVLTDTGNQRDISPGLLGRVAARAGLIVTDTFGALDEAVALGDEKAWRMVSVLARKK